MQFPWNKDSLYSRWQIIDSKSTTFSHYCILMRTHLSNGMVQFKKVTIARGMPAGALALPSTRLREVQQVQGAGL